MLRVVFDTSVLVPAFALPGSKSEVAFLLVVRGKILLFSSPAILAEVANKLRQKFSVPENEIVSMLKEVSKSSQIVRPTEKIRAIKDDPDNRILECAVAAQADLIVTGDKHLLKLKGFRGIGIARVAGLLYSVKE